MGKIKVAIAGVGNCASSLVQGIEYYKAVGKNSGFISGIAHNIIGDYRISDIEFVAAFDVDRNKVGTDLSDAIFKQPNCASKFSQVFSLSVEVKKGHVLDGLGKNLKEIIPVDPQQKEVNIANELKKSQAEILINFLPTGSKTATEFYAEEALNANCGFINAIPEPIAATIKWQKKYLQAELPLVGDDINSQLGATILHRTITDLFVKRGCKIDHTLQLNNGSNTDFINLSEVSRGETKITCKTEAIKKLIPYPSDVSVSIGTLSYSLDHLQDWKDTIIHFEGENFGSRPLTIDVKLHVDDSPNSAGVMVDVIRAMKMALDRGDSGVINPICGYFFKSMPEHTDDCDAYRNFEKYLE